MFAEAAVKCQARSVFEADGIWDLALKWTDFLHLVGRRRRGANGVFAGIEAKTLSQMGGIGAGDWGAKTFDRRKNLLIKIPFYIWF